MRVSKDTFSFRPGQPSDAHFLLSTWLKSYRNSGPVTKIPNDVYFEGHQDLIVQILGLHGTAVTVVCAKDDPDQIIGYVVYNTAAPILHYAYVKYPFRKLGLGAMLIAMVKEHHQGKRLHCTHIARQWEFVSRTHNLVFNPYFLGVSLVTNQSSTPPVAQQADFASSVSAEVVPEFVPPADSLYSGQEPPQSSEMH